ncbi:hypothetical protein K503DRAFT_858768 [Rhizopogon vinicolor AM-OR11-026]|uniref:DNA2/NAM7 helicase helicase domain-containing protein n=1 Tax=Rhizopogon vinicolor AM-OR11-026 TaxID=1314800 RepID=A0A1B7MRE8_9AGAM|nr:hypothetical protein K503DRAFT_858768 [Rhizopogon vinicolor AM-OR11-026]
MTPTDTQSRLRRFLRDNFRFNTTHDIYGFLIPLSSANLHNNTWTQEEGQLLLETLTSNIGRLRIAEIVTWPQVSPKAVLSREILSFQRGLIPLLRYMSSDFVVQSTLKTQANQLYMTVLQNLPNFADAVEKSMDSIIESRSFNDPGAIGKDLIDPQAFASIAGVLHEFLVRFKNAVATYPRLAPLVMNLQKWFGEWKTGISANPPSFDSALKTLQPSVRDLLVQTLSEKINKLVSIVEREQGKEQRSDSQKQRATHAVSNEGLLAALESSYEGPGALRELGPRHDNDFEDISDIRIAPTHGELMSRVPPFLPVNFFGAPHPAPPGSMQRLLDIQFRLLREELTAPLRKAVQLIHDDMTAPQHKKTKLAELLKNRGGKYRGQADMQDSLMFNVYTGVQFRSLVPDWKGISSSIIIDTPPGRARSNNPAARASFWEGMSGKRLIQGGLIALIWQSGKDVAVHLGVIANNAKELTEHARRDPDSVKLRIVFFDTKLELRILQELRNPQSRLDPSQADAVMDALTREVALIQGPPGTGKSFTGVELLHVLRANDVGPILMIAFTNHALDHMLGSVLDAKITNKIIRLGSRSADERIAEFSIEKLEMVNEESRLNRTFAGKRRELKNTQEAIKKLMENVLKHDLESDSAEIMKYLSTFHPEHHGYVDAPPSWIRNIKMLFGDDDDDAGEWQQQGRRGKTFTKDMSFYAFWRDGSDLAFIEALSDGSYAPWKPEPLPQEAMGNRFNVLEQDASPESEDEYATGEEDDDSSSESEDEDVPVEDAWMKVKVKPPSPEPASPKEAPAPPSRTTPPPPESETRNNTGISQADFKDLDGFLAEIGCSQLPIVPTSSRPLAMLLDRLDPSQADAVMDALTREVALIQGSFSPPGTGKSFTGVELLRVLRANNVGPILMIAFTNHALDHMLGSVLDAKITSKIIRLGSRSADERIAQFSIEKLEEVNEESRLNRTFARKRWELKSTQEAIKKLMDNVLKHDLESDSAEIMKYLSTFRPEHHGYVDTPPSWIRKIKMLFGDNDNDAGEWQQQGRRGKNFTKDMSFYAFWRDGSDLAFVEALSNGSYAPWRPEPPPEEMMGNKFNVLEQDASPELEDEYATGEEGNESLSESEDEDVPVKDAWMKVNVKPPSPETAGRKEAPAPHSPTAPPPPKSKTRNNTGISQADFKDLDGFLAEIGCSQLPIVPTSARPLDMLLEVGREPEGRV